MHRIVLILIALALFLIPQASVSAAAPNITRPADGALHFCPGGFKCTARAVGDFNGDHIDDLLFERALLSGASRELPATRQFDLYLSPFVPDQSAGRDPSRDLRASNSVQFVVQQGQATDPVSATDIDGDGLADLVFPLAQLDVNGRNVQQVTVVLGRKAGWSVRYKIDGTVTPTGTLQIARQAGPDDRSILVQTGQLALTAADLNGDGNRDLVFAVDELVLNRVDDVNPLRQQSSLFVQWGHGPWSNHVAFKPDVTITDLGACTAGLAGVGDVTGDGRPDLVVRRCAGSKSAPPQLRVIAGRANWPTTLTADNGALVTAPGIIPTAAPQPTAAPTAAPTAEPPPEGGGYLPSSPDFDRSLPAQVFLQDVSGDGVLDIGLEFAGKTNIWYGGPTIAQKVILNRTSAVYVKAGYGALPLTHSWRTLDVNGDGKKDLLLSKPIDAALLTCPSGVCQFPSGSGREANGQPLFLYTGAHATRRVVDPDLDAPDALFSDPANVIWGLGDFNGDGRDDVLLGSSPGAFDSVYGLVYGPLAAGK